MATKTAVPKTKQKLPTKAAPKAAGKSTGMGLNANKAATPKTPAKGVGTTGATAKKK